MNIIPIIASDQDLCASITEILKTGIPTPLETVCIADIREAVDFLNVEMPDLLFIDFSDKAFEAQRLLENILADPWLLHGGIIAICDSADDVRHLEEIRGANFIAFLAREDVQTNLPKVIAIVGGNSRILFQRELGIDLVERISGSYKMNNDPLEASCYANLICNFLFNANRIDAEQKFKLNFALYEMLINAIEHGNCGINYEEKTGWLEEHGSLADLIHRKNADPAVAAKKVMFEYTLNPTSARFSIADEGKGFNWRAAKDPTLTENLMELHGRGISMTRHFTRKLEYNESGNEVRFEIEYRADDAHLTPALLADMKSRELAPGDIVFKEGDSGDFLYYIVKGRYDVIAGGRIVSTLSPDDIFMGEMSFLLNNRRSATICAQTAGRLIEVSKKEFVNAIRKKPHYALFLSRLLAQRIERSNRK
jgi:CRP-like cAMP-binding protein